MNLGIFFAVLVLVVVAEGFENCTAKIAETNCIAPRDEGTRRGRDCASRAGRAWYFDERDNTCKQMTYLGCGGNGNRYCRRASCERACRANCPAQVERPNCRQNRDVGTRRGRDCAARAGEMWYYDPSDRQCKSMDYRGCGGNSNRYCSKGSCERACRRRP